MFKKSIFIYSIIGTAILIIAGLVVVIFNINEKLNEKEKVPEEIIISENPHYELELVKADLKTYGYLSDHVIKDYVKAVEECYEEYKVPIGLMHAVITIESDYRFWIEHDLVTPKELGYSVRAVGASAIIWELWKDTLINNKVADLRTDLFLPYVAIKSSGVILRYLIRDEAGKGYDNIVNRVLIRYYGAYLQSRYDKTIKITSELWVKRMNAYLKQLNKERKEKILK